MNDGPGIERVVKLGGSLLEWSAWTEAFRIWHASQTLVSTALVVGGGGMVDWLRLYDQRHHLATEFTHWLAIDAMSLTARLLAEQLQVPCYRWDSTSKRFDVAQSAWPATRQSSDGSTRGRLPSENPLPFSGAHLRVFDVASWLRDLATNHRPIHARLPAGWQTTSDSIAAALAMEVQASELVLLKSCKPTRCDRSESGWMPEVASLGTPIDREMSSRLVEAGQVDRQFAEFVEAIPSVYWVNLREQELSRKSRSV